MSSKSVTCTHNEGIHDDPKVKHMSLVHLGYLTDLFFPGKHCCSRGMG